MRQTPGNQVRRSEENGTKKRRIPRMMIQDPDLLKHFYEMTSPTADFISRQEGRKCLVKKFVSKYSIKPAQYYRPGLDVSSPMGRRLLESFSLGLGLSSLNELRKIIRSYERYCGTNSLTHRHLLSHLKACSVTSLASNKSIKIDLTALPSPDKGNVITSRLLRSQQVINPASNAWGLKSYHIYTFSKQERLEKMKTMESGLDWKGRLLSMHCEVVSLDVPKISKCDSCGGDIFSDEGHACGLVSTLIPSKKEPTTSALAVKTSHEKSPSSTTLSSPPSLVSPSRPLSVVVPTIKVVPAATVVRGRRT